MNHKVIIIGGDHSNTLGVIRTFGENNIKPYIIIHSKNKKIAVAKSKYVKKCWTCRQNEKEIVNLLLDNFKDETDLPVIITTSDFAALALDMNYNQLKDLFILSNIDNKENGIKNYMDKYNQYLLAKEHNVKMAKTYLLDLKKDIDVENLIIPCIVKPSVSANGNKMDIRICKNKDEVKNVISELKEKKYEEVIVQELIDYDYECDISGFVYNGILDVPGVILKQRIWPEKKGSTTFGKIVKNDSFKDILKDIENMLGELKYSGLVDCDVFVKGKEIYLNEINFRNGGISYALGKSYICYHWYLSCINKSYNQSDKIKQEYYMLDEQVDFHNVIEKKISLIDYVRDFKRAKIKIILDKKDFKPCFYILLYKVLNKVIKK